MPTSRRSLVVTALLALVIALATAGCGMGGLGRPGTKGYIDGDGVIKLLDVADREKPGTIAGTTLRGTKVSLDDKAYAGKVVVINVWGSWCPPCRAEADRLASAARELTDKGVVFIGINTRDNSADTALAFEQSHDMPYTSIFDPGGTNLLAFRHTLSPNAIPSTVILDAQGRVAASIIGEVTSAQTLIDLVDEVSK